MWFRLAAAVISLLVVVGTPARAFADAEVGDDGQGQWTGRVTWKEDQKRVGGADRVGSPGRAHRIVGPEPKPKPRMTKTEWNAFLAMCLQTYGDSGCREQARDTSPDPKKAAIALDSIARTLIVRLQLPDPTPQIGPDPTANEWKMAAVGYPLWLWTEGPQTVTSRVQAYGVTFTLRATWVSTTFDMGDGHSVTCTSTRAYTDTVKAGSKSPACGYTYLKSSLPKGDYTVTATTNWRIAWSALGQPGSLPGSHTGSRSLPVGELNALVVG